MQNYLNERKILKNFESSKYISEELNYFFPINNKFMIEADMIKIRAICTKIV